MKSNKLSLPNCTNLADKVSRSACECVPTELHSIREPRHLVLYYLRNPTRLLKYLPSSKATASLRFQDLVRVFLTNLDMGRTVLQRGHRGIGLLLVPMGYRHRGQYKLTFGNTGHIFTTGNLLPNRFLLQVATLTSYRTPDIIQNYWSQAARRI